MPLWSHVSLETNDGMVQAVAPEIISASRLTDIPAFYSDWFMKCIKRGYLKKPNPYNKDSSEYISFSKTKAVVFWTKNAKPLIPFLPEIDKSGLQYYFQFTLNDYVCDGLEPRVPSLSDRINSFCSLSDMIGKDRVIWRFDPLILINDLRIDDLIDKIERIGDRIANKTPKLVFSFADIGIYKNVQSNLNKAGVKYHDFSNDLMVEIALKISQICSKWGITPSTCAESIDFANFGIIKNKCIDDELILKITNNDQSILRLLGQDLPTQKSLFEFSQSNNKAKKDPGQRKECNCIPSKDIGQYNTCYHDCLYCYANSSNKKNPIS